MNIHILYYIKNAYLANFGGTSEIAILKIQYRIPITIVDGKLKNANLEI